MCLLAFMAGIATVTATHIGGLLLGTTPSFNIPQLSVPDIHQYPLTTLGLLIGLGIVMGLVSALFIRGLYWAEDRFDALPGNDYSRHALGMLCLGIMMYLLMRYSGHYYIQGVGYATIVDILTGVLSDPGFLLLLFALKLLATCLSLGSGASGGVFSPALFMGATIGAAIGGTTGAVLTGIIMLTEMTADQNVIIPLIIVVITAAAVRKRIMKESIYTMKLLRRGSVVPEGLQAAVTPASRISDLMRTDVNIIDTADPQARAAWVLAQHHTVMVPVMSDSDDLHVTTQHYIVAQADDNFVATLRRMLAAGAQVILVTRGSGDVAASDVIGVLGQHELARHTETLVTLL